MFRSFIVAAFLYASPATAASYFSAAPAAAPMADKIVVKRAVWTRNGSVYAAARDNSRPAVMCAALAKKVGPLKSFSIAGAPIAAADLDKCNARAR